MTALTAVALRRNQYDLSQFSVERNSILTMASASASIFRHRHSHSNSTTGASLLPQSGHHSGFKESKQSSKEGRNINISTEQLNNNYGHPMT